METIPLSVPNLAGNELPYIKECLDTNWVSSVGSYVDLFEKKLAAFVGAKYAVSTMNGTAALHLALQLAGVEANDLVIAPNITFIATINAIKYCEANPVLIDINPDTWQIDTELLENFLSENTYHIDKVAYSSHSHRRIKAIMPVHVLGNMCEMDKLMRIADKYHLTVVEDATEALGSYQQGKHAGTFGKIGCFSFNGNKIITTGGGGMIVTDDELLAKRAKHLTTQAKSDSFEYIHDEVGYNYRLVNILAAMGVAQMELLPTFVKRKQEINQYYREKLAELEIQFQTTSPHTISNHWLFTILTKRQKSIMQHLLANQVQVRPFWLPMNRLQMFEKDEYITARDFSYQVYQQSISLPCSTNITDNQLERVVTLIKQIS